MKNKIAAKKRSRIYTPLVADAGGGEDRSGTPTAEKNNIVTAFLGSYTISVTTNINSQTKAITLTYTIMNTSGWASATRFRKDNDGDGAHDGIIQDKARGAGIKLGGNLRETWGWTESIK